MPTESGGGRWAPVGGRRESGAGRRQSPAWSGHSQRYDPRVLGIGIDVGSTNVKVALVDDQGGLHGSASRGLVTAVDGDVATQDPLDLVEAVLDAVAEVVVSYPPAADALGSIGVCSQYSSIVGVDEACRPTTALIMYMDQRGADHCWAIMERHPQAFDKWMEHHGIPPIGAGLSLAHLLALQLDQPELHASTSRYVEVMDLVNAALTGRVVATQATMFASQLCDNRSLGTTEYDPELLAMSGVDADHLPQLIALDEPVGRLAPGIADRLGLSGEVVVQAAMNDTHAGAFATGVFSAEATGLMMGTTAVILEELDHPASDLKREVVTMPTPLEDQYLVMAENGLAGRPVAHVLGALLPTPGTDTRRDPFGEIAHALGESRPGAGGLLFLPWLAGSLSPSSDPQMRGGYLGMSLATTRADMVRATLEGTARNLRWLLPAVEDMTGTPVAEFTFGGGAARSTGWAQCLADVLGRPVSILEAPELAAARAVAMVGLGRRRGDSMVGMELPTATRLEPDPSATAVHDEIQGTFEEAFRAVQPICQALAP